jgi:hypothetical protein
LVPRANCGKCSPSSRERVGRERTRRERARRERARRERARGQQHGMRDATQKQHRRHILPVNAYAEVQAQHGAVPGLERADRLSACHGFALRQRRNHGLIAGEHSTGVGDRQHVAVDHEPDEVHDPISRCVHRAARRDIDAAVSGRILRGGRDEGSENLMGSVHGPRPARFGRRGGSGRRAERGHQPEE